MMNVEKKFINCYICKKETPTDIVYEDHDVRIVKCYKCGLMYQNPQLSEEHIQKISYQPNYFESYQKVEERQRIYFKNRFQDIFKRLKGGKVLDIGCGIGSFLSVAQEYGLEAYGVEVSEWASQIARKKQRLNIFTGLLENANFEDDTFEMIHMCHVLEHCAEPVVVLTEVKRILKQNGILFIEVPNEKNFKIRFWLINLLRRLLINGKINPLRPYPEHLFLYTSKTIGMMLNKADLDIINLKVEGFADQYRLNANVMEPDWKTYLLSLLLRTGIDVKIGLGSSIVVMATKH